MSFGFIDRLLQKDIDRIAEQFRNYDEVMALMPAYLYSKYEKDSDKFFYSDFDDPKPFFIPWINDMIICKKADSYWSDNSCTRNIAFSIDDNIQKYPWDDFPYSLIHIKNVYVRPDEPIKNGQLLFSYEILHINSTLYKAISESYYHSMEYQDYLNLIEFGESLDDWFDISFGKVNTYFNAKHDNKMPRKKNGKIDYYELKEMWLHS